MNIVCQFVMFPVRMLSIVPLIKVKNSAVKFCFHKRPSAPPQLHWCREGCVLYLLYSKVKDQLLGFVDVEQKIVLRAPLPIWTVIADDSGVNFRVLSMMGIAGMGVQLELNEAGHTDPGGGGSAKAEDMRLQSKLGSVCDAVVQTSTSSCRIRCSSPECEVCQSVPWGRLCWMLSWN